MFLIRRLGNFKILKIFLQFLLLTFIYALIYHYFGRFDSDRKRVDEQGRISLFHAFYFSLVTQTTVGYGDIGPKDKITKIICISQLLLTVIIMAVGLT